MERAQQQVSWMVPAKRVQDDCDYDRLAGSSKHTQPR
jgi:hypothetical protein